MKPALLAVAVLALAAGAIVAQLVAPARAQVGPYGAFHVAATAVGAMSHAWFVDPATRQIIHCRADNGSLRDCRALPIPDGTTRR